MLTRHRYAYNLYYQYKIYKMIINKNLKIIEKLKELFIT